MMFMRVFDECFSSLWTGRSFVRYSEPRTKTRWKCTPVKSSWRKMGEKSGKLPKMRSSSWKCTIPVQFIYTGYYSQMVPSVIFMMQHFIMQIILFLQIVLISFYILRCFHWQSWAHFLSLSRRRVKHHNILQLVDVFETRKEYFLFLEL